MMIGTLVGLLALSGASTITPAPAQPPTVACDAKEHRQFDFWIGRWKVTDAKTGELAGSSLIESLYGGCALRENWSEPGYAGGSLNIFSKADGQWHQTWVDQSGALREFKGGMEDGKMVLVADVVGAKGARIRVRMTFTANADGSVRQYSDYSRDDGATWTPRYDYIYRRAD